jgi:hypothetical protein
MKRAACCVAIAFLAFTIQRDYKQVAGCLQDNLEAKWPTYIRVENLPGKEAYRIAHVITGNGWSVRPWIMTLTRTPRGTEGQFDGEERWWSDVRPVIEPCLR